MYAHQNGVAALTLCSLPQGGTARKHGPSLKKENSKRMSRGSSLVAGEVDDQDLLENAYHTNAVPDGNSPEWRLMCKAFAKFAFRVPGALLDAGSGCFSITLYLHGHPKDTILEEKC